MVIIMCPNEHILHIKGRHYSQCCKTEFFLFLVERYIFLNSMYAYRIYTQIQTKVIKRYTLISNLFAKLWIIKIIFGFPFLSFFVFWLFRLTSILWTMLFCHILLVSNSSKWKKEISHIDSNTQTNSQRGKKRRSLEYYKEYLLIVCFFFFFFFGR